MKTVFTSLALFLVIAITPSALASEPNLDFLVYLKPIIELLAGKYGVIPMILGYMGVFRAIFKPTMTWLQSVVAATPTMKDDEFLAKVVSSKPYKILAFLVDWFASIKLPQPPAPPQNPPQG